MSNAAAVASPRFNAYDELISSSAGSRKPMNFHMIKPNGTDPNGIKANGIKANGIKTDGVKKDGIKPNGINPNGIKANGTDKNGIKANGINVNGTDSNGIKPDGIKDQNGFHQSNENKKNNKTDINNNIDNNNLNNNVDKELDNNKTNGVSFGLFKPEKDIPLIREPTPAAEPSSSIDHRNYDHVQRVAEAVRQLAHLDETPRVGIICGSGLGAIAEQIRESRVLAFANIPGFPRTSVVGHKGNLVFGWLDGTYVMCMQGRFHPYEHNMDLALCSLPVRIMHLLGVETLIVSNAAGGMNARLRSGDLMIIADHISMPALVGFGPLVGLNDPRFGPRFVSVHDAYDKDLRNLGLAVAREQGVTMEEGVYVMNGGPQYESPSEIRFLKAVGGDAVGMSTCHEVIVARQCGIRVFGFSLITNVCNTSVDSAVEVSHEEVIQTGKRASERACAFVAALVAKMRAAHLPEPRVPRVDSWQIS